MLVLCSNVRSFFAIIRLTQTHHLIISISNVCNLTILEKGLGHVLDFSRFTTFSRVTCIFFTYFKVHDIFGTSNVSCHQQHWDQLFIFMHVHSYLVLVCIGQESHSILSSVEERRLYDWSLARTGKGENYTWPFEVDITQTPRGDPPPRVNTNNSFMFQIFLYLSTIHLSLLSYRCYTR